MYSVPISDFCTLLQTVKNRCFILCGLLAAVTKVRACHIGSMCIRLFIIFVHSVQKRSLRISIHNFNKLACSQVLSKIIGILHFIGRQHSSNAACYADALS